MQAQKLRTESVLYQSAMFLLAMNEDGPLNGIRGGVMEWRERVCLTVANEE